MRPTFDAIDRAVDDIVARFEREFSGRARLAADRALARTLAEELQPVAHAWLEAVHAGAIGVDAREALALGSLWGRRAAALEATPSGAIEAVRLLLALLPAAASDAHRDLARSLEQVFFEGYVAAREERLEAAAARRAAGAIPILEPVRRGFFVAPCGAQDPAALEELYDDLGRQMLDRDARACLVHASGLLHPDRERAAALFAVRATCAMLGVRLFVSGLGPTWAPAIAEARIDRDHVEIVDDLPTGLGLLYAACGVELRERARLATMLGRWVPKRGR